MAQKYCHMSGRDPHHRAVGVGMIDLRENKAKKGKDCSQLIGFEPMLPEGN